MFAKLAANLLNYALGEYVEGVNQEKLDVRVWEGKITLEQLAIKPNALDFLHLPLAVKSGFVKRIHVTANWARIASEPVRIELNNVVVVAGPRTSFAVDKQKER